jgi:hypothetical protein
MADLTRGNETRAIIAFALSMLLAGPTGAPARPKAAVVGPRAVEATKP